MARDWFHCSANELLDRVTPEEIDEMQAEYHIEPWGDARRDVMDAVIARQVILPHLKSSAKMPELYEFMPFYKHIEEQPTEVELAAKIGAMTGHRE